MTKRHKADIWSIVSIILFLLFMVFLIYPLFGIMKQSVIGSDGSFSFSQFKKFFSQKY